MLTKARKNLLNNNNVAIFNNKVVVTILIPNPDKQIVIVQQNATRHTIHWIQIIRFAKGINCNVIFFLTEDLHIKRNNGQIVDNTNLLTIENGEEIYIGPGKFYYYIKMHVYLLTNLNTQLGMINRASTLVYWFITDLQGNNTSFGFI